MVRHPNDNDKKPRPRQDDRPRKPGSDGISGPRYSAAAPRIEDVRPPRPGGKSGERPAGKDGPRKDGSPRKDGPRKDGPRTDARGDKTPTEPKRSERIAKAMARAGIASRREVERLIGLGKVAVNGRLLDTAATLVTRDDVITVDGKPIGSAQSTRVWRYHKPVGLLTSHNDPAGRPTVFDALPSSLPRVISVGRLDINTEGLLLLTNDGELSRALELPTTSLVRQYRARARGRVTQGELDKLKDGVTVDGVRYGPVEATLDKAKEISRDAERSANLWISISITEGKNREVRKVLESVGLTVNRLIRLAYGPFQLGTLPIGAVEEVGPRVIRELLAEHIRPENLPTGNAVETPAPIPGRRTGAPIVKGRSGSAMSDPSRKPSRVRAAEAATEEGATRVASGRAEGRGAKKPGWAKAAPKTAHPKRTFKPREGSPTDGERPKRPWVTREGDNDRPKRDYKPRDAAAPRAGDDRPKRDFKPRAGGFGAKPGGARPTGGKPAGRPAGGKPRPGGPRGPR